MDTQYITHKLSLFCYDARAEKNILWMATDLATFRKQRLQSTDSEPMLHNRKITYIQFYRNMYATGFPLFCLRQK